MNKIAKCTKCKNIVNRDNVSPIKTCDSDGNTILESQSGWLCKKCNDKIHKKFEKWFSKAIKKELKKMKIAIVGSRSFNDYEKLCRVLEPYRKYCKVEICGCANGADTLGKRWANENTIKVQEFSPNWDLLGKKAGISRNKEMANEADFVVAFWDGDSRGTSHMINYSLQMKKNVLVVFYEI